jgi:3-isopropylmalate dehydrogenase
MTDGLFLECARKVAAEFPQVAFEDLLVDASTAHLVRNPERFDVLVAENFYGDILSDLASELSGSLGLAGSVMAGDELCCAQAQHGSAPDIAGQDKANPVSMILSVAMLVGWVGDKRGKTAFQQAGRAIHAAVEATLANPETRTADIGGYVGTRAFTEAVVAALSN